MTVSQVLVAGDTLSFTTSAPTDANGDAYRPADGWTLVYRLIPRDDGNSVIALTATEEDDDTYSITAAATTSASWGAGHYTVAAYVTLGSETYTVEPLFDQCEIKANPRTVIAGFDGRTITQKAYDDCLQAIADAAARAASVGTSGTATSGVVEYTIADRRVKYGNPGEALEALIKLRNQLGIELQRERAATAMARGELDPRRVYVRSIRG